MNRYLGSLGITLLFYGLCGGIWIFCNASSVKKELVLVQESISIQVSKEAIPEEPQVIQSPTPPPIKEAPLVKEQKPKVKVLPHKTLPSPFVEAIEEEKNVSFVLPPQEEKVTIPKQTDSQALHVKQQSYLQQLRERINQHKAYPKMAQQRNIEGKVMVEFIISAKGELLSYAIINGQTLFIKSAEEAIVRSFPFPIEEELFTENQSIKIEIIYALK